MKRIVDYTIIVGGDIENVEAKVKGKMDDGWQPLGGPFQGGKDMFQALVKYEDSLNAEQEHPGD
jgi:hypothetical protein